jgi:hypothetical protein
MTTTRLLFVAIFFAIMTIISCNQKIKIESSKFSATIDTLLTDSNQIRKLVLKYAESIDNADTVLGSKLFAHTKEVTFIHPGGHEKGWPQINNHIYKFFGETFAKRQLKINNEVVNVYDNAAWVEFYWRFDGVFKVNDSSFHSQGRETQMWRKSNNNWHLVHVHYSDMPMTDKK